MKISKLYMKKRIHSLLLLVTLFIFPVSLFPTEGDVPIPNKPKITLTPDISIEEGNAGTTTVSITIDIDECPDTAPIKISYFTLDNSAKISDDDYIQVAPTDFTFAKGSCTKSKTVNIQINGDTKVEDDEVFYFIIQNLGTSSTQPYSIVNSSRRVEIKNDEVENGADLAIEKWSDTDNKNMSFDQDVVYTLYAKNNGASKSRIKVEDTLPEGLEFISVNDDSGDFDCNYNTANRKLTCTGAKEFSKDQDVSIDVKVKVKEHGPKVITNTAVVSSPNNIEDSNLNNNMDSTDISVGVPGGGENTIIVKKTVDIMSPKVGDIVQFAIVVTNKGFDKKLQLKDVLPLTPTTDAWTTSTVGAFEYIEGSLQVTSGADINCSQWDEGPEFIYCGSNTAYTHDQSFTITYKAKVLKSGPVCNHVETFSMPDWHDESDDRICLNRTGSTPPNLAPIPDQVTEIGSSFTMNPHDVSFYASDADGDTLTYTAAGLPPGLSIDTNTGKISGITTTLGEFPVTLTIIDTNGETATDTFIIDVSNRILTATPNTYTTQPGIALSGNFISDDTGDGIDMGLNIVFVRNTLPSKGTLDIGQNGFFSYTPENNSSAGQTITFDYTITDDSGNEKSATVSIHIEKTSTHEGFKEFILINPPQTRNIIGDYLILGNTIECITNAETSYDGACQNANSFNNNNYMTKYLDIDNDTTTWNSSSSNFTLPENYTQLDGEGILWAGLFWQGSIHNNYSGYPQRRAYASANGYQYTDITSIQPINIPSTDGNKILLKVDDETSYTSLGSSTFYYDTAYDANGGYYAAYTDITNLLKSKNLAKGAHTLTVANITTNEGRDIHIGNIGGWSVVIIYKQDEESAKPRNISIYNGYLALNAAANGTPSKDIKISGFKLPKTGSVNAKFSTFAGEGEYVYGGHGTGTYDRMIMKKTLDDPNPKNMPGVTDPNNIFDAKLANIERDGAKNNDVENANGIDVDVYDVSEIMEDYRNREKNISAVHIGLSTSQDYITPSMVAFSTELYRPNLCYDYTQDIDGYILESSRNAIKTSFGSYLKNMTTRISVKSKEGDFALHDVNMTYRIHDTSQVNYKRDSTAIAPDDLYAYIPAGTSGLNQTYNQTTKGFSMYIGEGASSQPDGPGGVIDSFETRYFKFNQIMKKADVDTAFDLWVEYTIDYGSGNLHLSKNFNESSICQDEVGYFPSWGYFNVTSDEIDTTTGQPYNLYTQVANRDFNVKITSFDRGFTTPKKAKTAIEVEVFNAGLFSRDTNLSCNNPDANISMPIFVKFNDESSVSLENLRYNIAIRNAGFRVWYLRKLDGSVLEHDCTDRNDESCFRSLYTTAYPSDTKCNAECAPGGTGCYPCLRTYYGKPTCSRDNFAIRPEAFVTTLRDSNQSIDSTKESIGIAQSKLPTSSGLTNAAKLVSGYGYRFDINATNFMNDKATPGYIQHFNRGSTSSLSQMKWKPNRSDANCNDTEDQNISVTLFDGTSLNTYANLATIYTINQIGEYEFVIKDENWTAVDWSEALTTHHNATGFDQSTNDCIKDENSVKAIGLGKQGCTISSQHSHPNGSNYTALKLQYFPYTFNVSGLGTGAGTNNARNFVYINSLSEASGGRDENMSYNVFGTFSAATYTGERVNNFVDGCYADPVDMTLYHTYLTDVPTTTPNLGYDLLDYHTDIARKRDTFTNTLVQNTKAPLMVPQPVKAFVTEMNGSINMDLGFNFNRTNNTPLNPRKILFSDFNITYNGSPELSVEMKTDYKIYGNKDINDTVNFFYARAKAQQYFYDDITEDSVITPISVVLYCNLGFAECQNRGIMAAFAQTGEFDWWKSWNHNSATDGNIEITSTPTNALSATTVDINSKGENNTITVSKDNTAPLPQTVPVNFVTTPFPLAHTDRWLIYNPDSAVAVPNPFYKVRFIGNSGWAGHGDTGHVVGGQSNTKKSKRMEW
ncbi:MAG: putative Ig domain-containing protein [Sulfurovum sp.]|nr:putative Ig domain-containing protein [Sulfurovum sp.]